MNVIIHNPNHADYWTDVKNRAAVRKAIKIVLSDHANLHTSSIFERYVCDCLDIVNIAATRCGIIGNADIYLSFRAECSSMLALPELIELVDGEIVQFKDDAVSDALSEHYQSGY